MEGERAAISVAALSSFNRDPAGSASLTRILCALAAGSRLNEKTAHRLKHVIDEASAGDPSRAILPAKAQVDALHIACVAHHGIQYLLTWNCGHIANAKILPRIHDLLNDFAIPIPIICTPEELLGDDTEIDD
jgi:hypothetical protein